MAKRKRRATINYNNKKINDNIKMTDEIKIKKMLKKGLLGEKEELSWRDLDALICRPEGYSERIYKHGSIGRGYELFEEVQRFAGILEVRQVFKNWLKAMNLTMASVSKSLYPEKSQSYLSTMLNEDNKATYSDELVNEAFLKAKRYVDESFIKINGETIQDKALKVADALSERDEPITTEKTENKRRIKIEEKSENMNFIIITNFKTKKQDILNIGEDEFKKYNDFFESIKKVMEITQDVKITPFSTDNKNNV